MASVVLADRVKVSTATVGTGTVTLGAAFSNAFCTFAEAGVPNASTVAFCIEDGSDFELNTGVYTASGTTLTRGTPLLSKIAGVAGTTKLTLSGSATVRIVALAEHIFYNGSTDTTATLITGTAELGHASDTTLARESAGSVTIEGNRVYSALANQFPALTEKTAPTSADLLLIEDSAASDAKKKLQLGNVAPYIFHNLAADVAGTNVLTAQPWFPDLTNGAVTLASNTTYRFAGLLYISRSAGATSHTTGIGFGGTATVASIMGIATCKTGDTTALAAPNSVIINSLANTNIKAASTATTEQIQVVIEGTLRIGTGGGGTLIPQFTFSAAPGGVPTIKANSFFELAPIGTDLAVSAGTWS